MMQRALGKEKYTAETWPKMLFHVVIACM